MASELARVSTDVPLGYETLMEPDDPKLVHYVQEVLRPELERIGAGEIVDVPRNNLVVRVGSGPKALLIQNYTVSQHHNFSDASLAGQIRGAAEYGVDEPAVFGQGLSQNKAHQAVMLAVLRALAGTKLTGTLYWAVNNEGRSSHACSEAIIAELDPTPGFCIAQFTTGLKISLGNRGRVDVDVHVHGKETHSSRPSDGLSAIEGANEVINRLKVLRFPERHPQLGERQAVVYKVRYEPLAPHTLPSDAYLTIDRRLLPGDDPASATEEIREAIGDMSPYGVTVDTGVYMLPCLLGEDHPGVHALQAASGAETYCYPGTYDAGGPSALGIPTVMFGASGGSGLTGVDFVPVSAMEAEARALARFIEAELG